jgi:hypothetical protein
MLTTEEQLPENKTEIMKKDPNSQLVDVKED